jgi:tRNA-Thr(GGU) m(6)t(6)A37 methyltransferase TsaA
MKINGFSLIGIIHSPYKEQKGVPIQPVFSDGITAEIEVFSEFQEGLKDLDGFSHIILLYQFHKSKGYSLLCQPFLDTEERGLFSTRAPKRPNPIGLSVVELIKIEKNIITIGSPDVIDNTPLLDIKPYVDVFDAKTKVKNGWYDKAKNKQQIKADERFID